jgi:hypothetical protein
VLSNHEWREARLPGWQILATAWAALPSFIQAGERFLGRLGSFVEQVASQAHRVRDFVDRAQR